MKLFFLSFALIASAFAQSNELVLCDQQATTHCLTWTIGNNLPGDYTLSGPPANAAGGLANNGSGALSWVPYLPLAGGTETGAIRLAGGYGNSIVANLGSNYEADPDPGSLQSTTNCTFPPAFDATHTYVLGEIARSAGTTYTSLAGGNLNHTPPNVSWWTPACVDDRTRIDWIGMEGVFLRIKGKGTNTIGDYYDWTRFTAASSALPLHQVNFNDSSFNTLIHIDSANYPLGTFEFTGEILSTIGAATGQVTGDRTQMDYFGFEGNFFRVKAQGNLGGVDYFDWTRWGNSTTPLPAGQLNLNDVSFRTILHIDNNLYPLGSFEFTGVVQTKIGAGTGQVAADQTKVDYFGMEGNFVRIKATGASCGGGPCGDYFDWTRWTSGTTALPQHQLNLNDSSFNALIHIDESGGLANTTYSFTGEVLASLGMTAPIYRISNGLDYFDLLNATLGTHAWDLRDSSSFAIETYRNASGTSATGTFTFNGNLVINGSCTGCGAAGGTVTSVTGTANQVIASPTTGAVVLRLPQDIAATSIPTFTGLFLNLGTGQVAADQTKLDYFGMEGNFVRVKGTGISCGGGPCGDYFDWTRWTSNPNVALPQHQLNLNDSSFNTLIHIDESSGFAATVFSFTGNVWASSTVQSPLYRLNNGSDYFDFLNTGLGTHAWDLRDSAAFAVETYRNSSGNSATGTFTFNGNVTVTGTCTGCGAGGGGVTSITGTTNQVRVSPPGTGAVTLSLPQEIATSSIPIFGGLLINQALNDGSGYQVQVTGGIEAKGSGINILSQGTAANALTAPFGGVTAHTGYWVDGTQVINQFGTWLGLLPIVDGTAIQITRSGANYIINNTGVTSLGAGNGILLSGSGAVTVALNTGANVTFNQVTAGTQFVASTASSPFLNSFSNTQMQILGDGTIATNSFVNAGLGFKYNGAAGYSCTNVTLAYNSINGATYFNCGGSFYLYVDIHGGIITSVHN